MSGLPIFFVFSGEILLIYALSRFLLQRTYESLWRFGWSNKTIIGIVSLLYVPGTLIHELSHFFVALILNLHPSEITVIPVIEGNKIKLGHVLYQRNKGEFIRPILVGIAPFFGAMGILWAILHFRLFPGGVLWQTILFGYLILAITANMFSSPKDLADIGYLVPVAVIAGIILYLFPVSVSPQFVSLMNNYLTFFLGSLQPALLFSIAFHVILILLLFSLNKKR